VLTFTRHFEGTAATAAPYCIRIGNLEAGAGKPVGKVNRRTLQEVRTVGVHQDLYSILLDAVITVLHMVKLHAILHPCAAASLDENPEPFVAIVRIFRDENVQLAKGRFRDRDH
jgi:hypothetical protein